MGYWGWKPYVPAAARKKKAEGAAAKAKKAGATLSPVLPSRGAIAKTFWGKAWCDNLERYSDYANRLPRGRTYVRNGSVIDLEIGEGEVCAQVMGTHLYRVEVRVAAVAKKHWKSIGADCAGSIDSMVELLQGTFAKAVMQRLCRAGDGLFPAPKEIEFNCSCPDWASMCKHVAAVLYGVGARLDEQPELLFKLRRVDEKDLLAQAGAGVTHSGKLPAKGRVLDEPALGDVFGIEMAPAASAHEAVRPVTGRSRKAATEAAGAAAKATTKVGTRSAPTAKGGARSRKTASTRPARGTETAKAPARARREAVGNAKPLQPAGATRKKPGAPKGVAGKAKTKRKPKA